MILLSNFKSRDC